MGKTRQWCVALTVAALVLAGIGGAVEAAETKPAKKPKKASPTTQPAKAPTTQPAKAQPKLRVAHMRLGGTVLTSPPGFSLFGDGGQMTLRDWLQRLAKARNDQDVHAVALELDGPSLSWAQAQELADAVKRLDEVKPVHAFITVGGASDYLIASAAREVAMEPMGSLMITGLAAELTFYRGTMNLLGIQPQFIQIGKFKGAAEPYDRTEPSEELKGEYNKILDDLFDQLVGQIARQRRLKFEDARKAVDAGPFTTKAALEHKLIDRLISRQKWQAELSKKAAGKECQWTGDYGKKDAAKVDFSNPFALLGALTKVKSDEIREPAIAIINCEGMIVDGQSGEGLLGGAMAGAKTLVKCFEEMAADDRVKAVVFRIDSPGGSALASEMIYQAVKACAAKKPVIASIGQTGASGGYYVALGAKTIYADPCGLVGSIGVVSGKLAVQGLMSKVGITTTEITRGANAGLRTSRAWTDRETEIMRKMAQEVYEVFTARVAESRGKKIPRVEDVAQGRIFTARQASTNGLVDQLGGMREAILAAQESAKIGSSHFIVLPRPRSLMDVFSEGEASTDARGSAELALLRHLARGQEQLAYMINLARLLGRENVLAVVPHHAAIR